MKKWFSLCMVFAMLLTSTACGKKEPPVEPEPQVSQMRSICELAVMDCYYHNVAKYFEKDASGVLFWKKDKHFWIEYSGVVRIGVDMTRVEMTVEDDLVTITLPEAEVQGCWVDSASLTEDSYIVAKDSAEITAEDETKAFDEAQSKLEEVASADRTLLAEAQQRVQSLMTDYVKNIGNTIGKEYTIRWVYVDGSGNQTGTETDVPSATDGASQDQETKTNAGA